MRLEDMTDGKRVRIARPIEYIKLGTFEVGLTGTVRDVEPYEQQRDVLCHVLLDEKHPELGLWGNNLQVYDSAFGLCSPDHFEQID